MDIHPTKLAVVLTGASGLVGEGVLLTCLEHPDVERVLTINRRAQGRSHPKLSEVIVPDFLNLTAVLGSLTGYNAVFYCAGISSSGMNESDYTRITYETTIHVANELLKLNPQMTFVHVSGSHADSSEKGRVMWARVKGKTENELMRMPFASVYNVRPAVMKPSPGQRNIKGHYKVISWMFPLLQTLFPNQTSTLQQVGLAMIHCVLKGYAKQVLEVADINALAGE